MSTATGGAGAHTYIVQPEALAEVIDLVEALESRGVRIAPNPPALVGRDGQRIELPEPIFDALRQVATALSHGQAVTVAPQNTMLTTQEAADFLGISRPTLVRLLSDGEVPYEMRGRHRRVLLTDLLDYQQHARIDRAAALDDMAEQGQEAGLYDATAGPPPRTR